MKAKKQCWMAKSAGGKLQVFTASQDRETARAKYLSMIHDRTWKWLYRHGHRIVRVSIREV